MRESGVDISIWNGTLLAGAAALPIFCGVGEDCRKKSSSLLSESVIEGRKRFLDYLATETVSGELKPESAVVEEQGESKDERIKANSLEKTLEDKFEPKTIESKHKPERKRKTKRA